MGSIGKVVANSAGVFPPSADTPGGVQTHGWVRSQGWRSGPGNGRDGDARRSFLTGGMTGSLCSIKNGVARQTCYDIDWTTPTLLKANPMSYDSRIGFAKLTLCHGPAWLND